MRLAFICAVGILLLAPQAAAGGGWWSHLEVDRTTVTVGQRVEVKSFVTFSSDAAAREAQATGGYSVHLLRGFDPAVLEPAMRQADPGNWWTLGDAEAIPVGPVTVGITDANLGWARAAFTVPEIEPGTYHVMLCDATCAEPLATVFPAQGFTVVADPATAQLTQRADRLSRRLGRQATQLAEARGDAYRARSTAEDTQAEIEQLQRRIAALAAEVRRPEPVPTRVYVGWLLAAVLAGALVVLVRRHRESARAASWQPSDEELRELLASEPEHHHR